MGTRSGSVAAAAARATASGASVVVRATERGFYGRPLPSIKNEGDKFRMLVSDLKPFKRGRHHTGAPIESVTVDGVLYALPSWVEDATQPAVVEDDVPEIDETDPNASADDDSDI